MPTALVIVGYGLVALGWLLGIILVAFVAAGLIKVSVVYPLFGWLVSLVAVAIATYRYRQVGATACLTLASLRS